MRLTGIHIKSFRAIRDVTIDSVENALILVGQNNTGKSTIIDALRVALGDIAITKKDFNWDGGNIEIALTLELTKDDLKRLCRRGIISHYRKFDSWFEDFQKKLPSFVPMFETDGESINERGELSFALSQIRMAESAILTALKRTILILKSCFHVSIVSVLSVILSGYKVIFYFFVRTR